MKSKELSLLSLRQRKTLMAQGFKPVTVSPGNCHLTVTKTKELSPKHRQRRFAQSKINESTSGLSGKEAKTMRVIDINKDTLFRPCDFTNGCYYGMSCYNRKNQPPVLLMMSKSSNPPHWLVVDGYKQMYYLKRADAVDYCKRMGYIKSQR